MIALTLFLTLAAAMPGKVLFASGGWAAIDRGATCEALSRSLRAPAKELQPGIAGFAFDSDRRRWGRFHVRLGRQPRAGSTVVLDLGGQPFLLESRGIEAWARNSAQDQAIIDALRGATAMKVSGRDSRGRRFSELFEVRGAATAIDSAAARCAGKSR